MLPISQFLCRYTLSEAISPMKTSIRRFHRTAFVLSHDVVFDRFIDAAASGDHTELSNIPIGPVDINKATKHGMTALMLSAKSGHDKCVEKLLQKGSNPALLSHGGHSARDLALFWNHTNTAKIIDDKTFEQPPNPMYFCDTTINRLSAVRPIDSWIERALCHPEARIIVMHKAKPLVKMKYSKKGNPKPRLFRAKIGEVGQMIEHNRQNLIFLGMDTEVLDPKLFPRGKPLFSLDIDSTDVSMLQKTDESLTVLPMFPGMLTLPQKDASICGQARSLFDWHFRHKYCPSCGTETKSDESGYKRICLNTDCLSHTGVYNTNYPRVDPTVIAAVISPDTTKCLLARKASFPPGMFTCLAGFMEPGENIETAAAREIEEESGVRVSKVEYFGSQPWPMPSALMIGCLAFTESGGDTIKLDKNELEEARWFERTEVVNMLTRQHADRYFVPPPQAIAHHLIKQWVLRTAR